MSADSEYKPQNEVRGQERTGIADASLYVNAESGVDATREDREAVKSESTGRIPQSKLYPFALTRACCSQGLVEQARLTTCVLTLEIRLPRVAPAASRMMR